MARVQCFKSEWFNSCITLIVEGMSKNHQPIILHCVNQVKSYFNLYVNNLKLLKIIIRHITFLSEQHNECYNYKNY